MDVTLGVEERGVLLGVGGAGVLGAESAKGEEAFGLGDEAFGLGDETTELVEVTFFNTGAAPMAGYKENVEVGM